MNQRSSLRQKILYSFGQIANGAYNGVNIAILPVYLLGFTSNPFILGYLGNTRTMEGVIIQPLVGRWSDRSTSPLGRRRPFILFGIPLAVLCLLLIPIAGHITHARALPFVAIAILLFSIFWNIASDPYQALLVDITTPRQRPIFNAILSVISLLGQVAVIVYASVAALKKNNIPDIVFYAAAVAMVINYAIVFAGVREPHRAAEMSAIEQHIPFRVYLSEMLVFKEAFKLLISIFFLWTGLNAFEPFIGILPIKLVHATKSEALLLYGILILAAAICAYPFGRLAVRYGSRPMIVLGTLLLIVAAVWGLFVPSYFWFVPLAIVAGAGFSATTALTYPYLAQLVPESRIGVFTGLQTAFSAVALPLGVAVVGTLIHFFGYRSVFAMLAISMVLDVLVLLSVDEAAAGRQVRDIEQSERQIAGGIIPSTA